MSESLTSILIAAGILFVLALFVPCMESLARILRRRPREAALTDGQQAAPPQSSKVA